MGKNLRFAEKKFGDLYRILNCIDENPFFDYQLPTDNCQLKKTGLNIRLTNKEFLYHKFVGISRKKFSQHSYSSRKWEGSIINQGAERGTSYGTPSFFTRPYVID